MNVLEKIKESNKNIEVTIGYYNNYVALDWSLDNMAIARMKPSSERPKVVQVDSDIKLLKEYANNCIGSKILCIEETTGSHCLYVELKDHFDKILICDPYQNSLLLSGAKTDKIDALKLCQLLRAGLLKEVYHSLDDDYHLRKMVSAYEDWVKFGVRFMNQKSALYRSLGLKYKKDCIDKNDELLTFIESHQNDAIELYKEKKKKYAELFKHLRKKNRNISNLTSISGISDIFAVTIYSVVIDANRFDNKYKYWAYCGLVKHEKESGGRSYGKRNPRYSRKLKFVYKSAALAAIEGKNDIHEYYEHLLRQGSSISSARNAIARYIAKVSLAILKNNIGYVPFKWRRFEE